MNVKEKATQPIGNFGCFFMDSPFQCQLRWGGGKTRTQEHFCPFGSYSKTKQAQYDQLTERKGIESSPSGTGTGREQALARGCFIPQLELSVRFHWGMFSHIVGGGSGGDEEHLCCCLLFSTVGVCCLYDSVHSVSFLRQFCSTWVHADKQKRCSAPEMPVTDWKTPEDESAKCSKTLLVERHNEY